jgi:hypothetical protein
MQASEVPEAACCARRRTPGGPQEYGIPPSAHDWEPRRCRRKSRADTPIARWCSKTSAPSTPMNGPRLARLTPKKGVRAGPRVGCPRGRGHLCRQGGCTDSTDHRADRAPALGARRPRGHEGPHHGALDGGGALGRRGHAGPAAKTLSGAPRSLSGGRRTPSKGG